MINSTPHISSEIQSSFADIGQQLLTMASRCRNALADSGKGFLLRDNAVCQGVIAADEEIDTLDDSINHKAMEVLVRYRPVAIDMRTTLVSLRLSTAFERIGDESVSIARKALKLNQQPKHANADSLETLFVKVRRHFEDCLISYTEKDIELAKESIEKGKGLVGCIESGINKLSNAISDSQAVTELQSVIDLTMICRSLNNIVGYSRDVANEMIFLDQDIPK